MVKLSHLKLMGGLEEDAAVDEDAGLVDVVAGAAWPDRMCNMCNKDNNKHLYSGIQLNFENCSITFRWYLK